MLKILRDTLIKPNGNFDKQALSFFVCFVISIILGGTKTYLSWTIRIYDNRIAMEIFDSFMILTGAFSGVNVANKYVDIVKAKNQNNQTNEFNQSGGSY